MELFIKKRVYEKAILGIFVYLFISKVTTTKVNFHLRTDSDGYIKGDKYLFFIKVGAANVLLKLNYL